MDASTRTSPRVLNVDSQLLERFADLIVGLGANVQPGQIVEVRADLAKRALVRAVAASAYRRGAKFVDPQYIDPYVRRARIVHADPETLDFVPEYDRRRVLELGELRCARVTLAPVIPPQPFADLDPALVAREPFPYLPEYNRLVTDNTTNWTVAPCPDEAWAPLVRPDFDGGEALAALWDDVVHVCRLDEPDPVAAWERRFAELAHAAGWLNGRRFDALHFEGPGTDLVIGLLPGSIWQSGPSATVDGLVHAPNIPTEETFTGPDPQRVDGVVTSTKPLLLKGGTLVEGLVVRFEGGRAVQIDAARGAEALRETVAKGENGDRLGEVALVDRAGRIGALGTVFYTTLLDENAASHVALGNAYPETAEPGDRDRLNRSSIHVDFMLGGDDVDVTGVTREGDRVPVLRGGEWQI